MMTRWKLLGWQALLAAAVVTAPAVAADSDKPLTLEEIGKEIKAINEKLGALKTVSEDVKALKTELGLQIQKAQADVQKTQKDIGDVNKELLRLQAELSDMRKRMEDFRKSFSVNPNGAGAGVATGMGRVRLRNTFLEPVSIVVNGESIRLRPGETYVMEMPAGSFVYEVLGIQAPLRRTLAADEMFTINVYTR